jgi:hypothetical protein
VTDPVLDPVLDLDAPPTGSDLPPHRHRRALAAAVLAVTAGASGAGLAVAVRPAEPAAHSPVVASVHVETVVLNPGPTALLELQVENLGAAPSRVLQVDVQGGGSARTVVDVRQRVEGGDSLGQRLDVSLDCANPAARSERVTVTVRTDAGAAIDAVGVGRAGQLGGLCAAADAALPGGWRTPARASSWSIAAGVLDLVVTGLPDRATGIVSVEADGVLLPQSRTTPSVNHGAAHLQFPAPAPGCRDGGVRPTVPTGIQVLVQSPDGLATAYVPVGAALGEWLMDAFVAACPSRPNGPGTPPAPG